MRIYSILLLLFISYALSANPLTNCGGGRGVPYTLAASGGACSLPTIGIPPANVNEAFFAAGAKCGACYEVTGPLGVQTVQILDDCPASTATGTCAGDKTQFAIDEATFGLIANRTSTDIIYDLGFREVTCAVTGNVKMQATDTSSVSYFFSIKFWNFRVAVTDVRVKATGWSDYQKLTRQGSSGVWSWNKADQQLKFPITIYLVGSTEELIQTTVNDLTQGSTVDFGDQFTNVVSINASCPQSASPAVVYSDSVGYGWDTSHTFTSSHINLADTASPYSGTSDINVGLYQYGGLLFTRNGGFNPQYFSYLSFAAKANSNANIKVYMGSGEPLYASVAVTTQWQVFNVSVSSLTTNTLETDLAFLNLESNLIEFYFDQISWVLSPSSPLDNVPQVSTTGGIQFSSDSTSGVVLVDTTGTTGFSFGSSDEHHTSGAISTSVSCAFLLVLLSLFM